MPDIEWGAHLVEVLFEFGPVRAEGPLEVEHIKPIEKALCAKFQPWEKRLLLRLSRAYLGEVHKAKDPGAKPPWPTAEKQWRRVQSAKAARNLDAFLK